MKRKIKERVKRVKKIVISSPEEIFSMMNRFELRWGRRPFAIITTIEKRESIIQYLGCAPEEVNAAMGFSLRGIPIITPQDIMIL